MCYAILFVQYLHGCLHGHAKMANSDLKLGDLYVYQLHADDTFLLCESDSS